MAELNEDEIRKLKANKAFQMSLSGKELFHSNMVAMFLTDTVDENDNVLPSELAKKVMRFFPPKEGIKENTVVFDVLRERFNLDLVIVYCTIEEKEKLHGFNCYCVDDIAFHKEDKKNKDDSASDSGLEDDEEASLLEKDEEKDKEIAAIVKNFSYVIIENKFKSFPYIEQLNKYSNKDLSFFTVKKKTSGISRNEVKVFDHSHKCYLFAPEESLNIFYKDKEWNITAGNSVEWEGKSYNEYCKKLKEEYLDIDENKDDSMIYKFIREYQKFLETMLNLYKTQIVDERINKGKVFLSDNQNSLFLKARIQDFYEKILFNQILSKFLKDLKLPENYTELKGEEKEPFIYSGTNYTRQSGIYDFRFVWLDNNITQGIQIQNNRFEIVICADFNFYKKASNWKEDFEKKTEIIGKFKGYFDKFKDECTEYSESIKTGKETPETSQIKWIRHIYKKIQEKYNSIKLEDDFLKFKMVKGKIDLPGYTTKDYVYRYAYIDLNELSPGKNYREIEYGTLKGLLEVAINVITDPDNRYPLRN